MNLGARVVEVARQQALQLPERMPGFRGEAVVTLIKIIKEQDEGVSNMRRKQGVQKLASDLGTAVLSAEKEL